jgi:hypothetical protein
VGLEKTTTLEVLKKGMECLFDSYTYNEQTACYEFYLNGESDPRVEVPIGDSVAEFKLRVESLIQLLSELKHEEHF